VNGAAENAGNEGTAGNAKHKEALNKGLALFLDAGCIRLCKVLCEADAALFRGSISTPFERKEL
jgi:hypothetical protein